MNKTKHIRSLRDVKGATQARIYSIPKQQRSAHLDLYVLAREKERLGKELFQVQLKSRQLKKKLDGNNKRMSDILREIGSQPQDAGKAGSSRGGKASSKKMQIEY